MRAFILVVALLLDPAAALLLLAATLRAPDLRRVPSTWSRWYPEYYFSAV
jgi:hypothetical protein